jgi:MFS family permease
MLAGMTVMANATISPSLPGLREHYADVSNVDTLAGLLVTLPSLAVVLAAGPAGWLADKVDRQRLLLTSGLLYAAGGTSGLWVDDMFGMLAGRLVLGVGVAGTMVLATTWTADLWHGDARTRFLGRQGAATSAGGIVVILIGGALATLHWRGAFGAYLLVVPVTLLAVQALSPHARLREGAPPASSGGSARAERFPWRAFAFVGSLGFLLMIAFYAIPTRLPFLLGELGVSAPLTLSLFLALVTVAALPGALAYGRIRRRFAPATIFSLSWALMGAGMLIASRAPNPSVLAVGLVFVGLGLSTALPGYTAYLMDAVPPTARGRASGLLTIAFFAGQFASPLISAPLVAAFGLSGTFLVVALGQFAMAAALAIAAALQWRVVDERPLRVGQGGV